MDNVHMDLDSSFGIYWIQREMIHGVMDDSLGMTICSRGRQVS
jgi:hypothetical protein